MKGILRFLFNNKGYFKYPFLLNFIKKHFMLIENVPKQYHWRTEKWVPIWFHPKRWRTAACFGDLRDRIIEYHLFYTKHPEIFRKFVKEINNVRECRIIDELTSKKGTMFLIYYNQYTGNDYNDSSNHYIRNITLLGFLRDISENSDQSVGVTKYKQAIVDNFNKVPKIYKGIYYLTYLGHIASKSFEKHPYSYYAHSTYCEMKPVTKKEFINSNITNQQFFSINK